MLRNQLAFHAQQAAEKALKAVLIERAVRFPRTHDLEALTELVRLAKLLFSCALAASTVPKPLKALR